MIGIFFFFFCITRQNTNYMTTHDITVQGILQTYGARRHLEDVYRRKLCDELSKKQKEESKRRTYDKTGVNAGRVGAGF